MCQKIVYPVCFVLVLGSIGYTADVHWTGAGGDKLWSNQANWEFNKVPAAGDNVFVNMPAAKAPNGPIIQDGMDFKINGLSCEVAGEPTMTMTGGTLEIADYIWWGDDQDCDGIFNMSGGTITVGNEFELGWGGGSGTWIMTGGTVSCGELIIPTGTGTKGELYLHGGTVTVGSDGLEMQPVGMIDIGDGTLILEGDLTEQINGLIDAGQITFYGGSGLFVLDYDDRNPGMTTLSARWTGIAYNPTPSDGAYIPQIWVSMSWSPDDIAATHDVYLGNDYDEVANSTGDTFRGNQGGTFYVAGFAGYPYPDGLVPGTTYYWRVDEVEADGVTKHKGDIWSFTVPPRTAYNPVPADGAEFVDPNAILSWTAGFEGKMHTIYIGDDFDEVNIAEGADGQGPVTYDPGTLELGKVYYWRVDEYDGTSTYKGDVWSFTTPGAVGFPFPANGAKDVQMTTILGWTPADSAASHELYFGTDKDAVRNADKNSPEYKGPKALGDESYDPGKLAWYTTYYWRVDEVDNLANTSKGPLWSFTTADFILVDDFEDYDTGDNQIWYAWRDGLGFGTPDTTPYSAGNGTGSAVGDETTPSYCEERIVHGGEKSMPLAYDNNKQGFSKYSEVDMTLRETRDWTEEGVGTLTIWFRGKSDNDAEPLYVALSNSSGTPAVVVNDDPAAAQVEFWTKWEIPLQAFADQGNILTDVDKIAIGLGTQGNLTTPGGAGKMYFDDIGLYRPEVAP